MQNKKQSIFKVWLKNLYSKFIETEKNLVHRFFNQTLNGNSGQSQWSDDVTDKNKIHSQVPIYDFLLGGEVDPKPIFGAMQRREKSFSALLGGSGGMLPLKNLEKMVFRIG